MAKPIGPIHPIYLHRIDISARPADARNITLKFASR